MCQFRHFGDLFYKLLMEKLQLCALMPFMLYMPYSTLFVQEIQARIKFYQVHKKLAISENFAISEMLAKFQ